MWEALLPDRFKNYLPESSDSTIINIEKWIQSKELSWIKKKHISKNQALRGFSVISEQDFIKINADLTSLAPCLEKLPESIAWRVIEETRKQGVLHNCSSIKTAFLWMPTEEGWHYWNDANDGKYNVKKAPWFLEFDADNIMFTYGSYEYHFTKTELVEMLEEKITKSTKQ